MATAVNGQAGRVAEEPDAIRPPLKWAGGKRWLAPRLRVLYEPYRDRRLVEPLCGGLAVALGLQPRRALLNDISPHAWNFYQRLKAGFSTTLEMRNDEQLYYRHRERFNQLISEGKAETTEAAALFYFLNRTGYNGLCRFNSSGGFNVPFGRYTTINYTHDFASYRSAFTRWTFTSTDFSELSLRGSDFVYADPPYDVVFTRCERGLRLGRSSKTRGIPRRPSRASSSLESEDRSNSRSIREARLLNELFERSAPHQLQGT